jgi:hypothetical protein
LRVWTTTSVQFPPGEKQTETRAGEDGVAARGLRAHTSKTRRLNRTRGRKTWEVIGKEVADFGHRGKNTAREEMFSLTSGFLSCLETAA